MVGSDNRDQRQRNVAQFSKRDPSDEIISRKISRKGVQDDERVKQVLKVATCTAGRLEGYSRACDEISATERGEKLVISVPQNANWQRRSPTNGKPRVPVEPEGGENYLSLSLSLTRAHIERDTETEHRLKQNVN